MRLVVKGKSYRIEYRHVTKLGKRAQLHRGSLTAVTTCIVSFADQRAIQRGVGEESIIAIDNALCVEGDKFSYREGRGRAFQKVLDHCGALREVRAELWREFHRVESGIEDCPTCGAEGWLTGDAHEGEACPNCRNILVIGGTGLKGGVLLVLPVKGAPAQLLFPPPPARPPRNRTSEAVIQAHKNEGAEVRAARQRARAAS